jgi:peptidoglycan-N-acetylmuramic acid deacetylase
LDSIDNTPYGWGVVRNKDHITPQISTEETRILTTYDGIYYVEAQEKVLFLTFNLGYESGSTEGVLDRLRERNIKAVFFLTGDYINDENNASIINRIKDEGHLFGNHGYTHTDYTELSSEAIVEDYNRLSNELYEKYSVNCSYVRPPYCKYSERVVAAGSLLSYKTVFWSIAFDDYGANKGKDYAYNTLMDNLHPGAIILIHPTYTGINDYFEDFLDSAMGEGYKFELLHE